VAEPDYEEVDHTADWAIRVRGRTLSDLLMHAATAVMELTGTRLAPSPTHRRTVSFSAPDPETLLVVWLEDLLHAMESRRVGFCQMQVEATPGWHLKGAIVEAPVVGLARPIKAVTFHNLAIRPAPLGLETLVVFDV
jgi:SHS2 domain-containing protein